MSGINIIVSTLTILFKQLNKIIMQKIKYYLMRHAEYYDKDNQFITYKGVTDLKKSVDTLGQDLLIDFIGDIWETQRVRIIHSSLPRAVHTALLVKEILYNISIVARLKPDSNLNSDRLCLTKEYVETLRVNDFDFKVITDKEERGKHKYAYVLGKNKMETKNLKKLFESRNKTYQYPKERGK